MKPENPPAFAKPDCDQMHAQSGMSLRDYFAGQALVGLLAMPLLDGERDDRSVRDVIFASYAYADAMLEQRQREEPDETNRATPPQDA